MSPVEFEPIVPASERPQTHNLDRAATGIGFQLSTLQNNCFTFYIDYTAHELLRMLSNALKTVNNEYKRSERK